MRPFSSNIHHGVQHYAFAGLAIGTLPFGALRDLVGATRRDATAQLVIHHATEPA